MQETLDGGDLTLAYLLHVLENQKPFIKRNDFSIYDTKYGRLYITIRQFEIHFFRKWGTWGISQSNLLYAKSKNVTKVIVLCKDWPTKYGKKTIAWISDIDAWFISGKKRWWSGEQDLQLHLKPEEMEILP